MSCNALINVSEEASVQQNSVRQLSIKCFFFCSHSEKDKSDADG